MGAASSKRLPPPRLPREPEQVSLWAKQCRQFLKAELLRRSITYADLADRLTRMGLRETEGSITMKINRGRFPAWFMLAALTAIGAQLFARDDRDDAGIRLVAESSPRKLSRRAQSFADFSEGVLADHPDIDLKSGMAIIQKAIREQK